MKAKKPKIIKCRLTEDDYKKVCLKAEKQGLILSDYIRQNILPPQNTKLNNVLMAEIVIRATEIVRDVEEKYIDQDNEELTRKVAELWSIL